MNPNDNTDNSQVVTDTPVTGQEPVAPVPTQEPVAAPDPTSTPVTEPTTPVADPTPVDPSTALTDEPKVEEGQDGQS